MVLFCFSWEAVVAMQGWGKSMIRKGVVREGGGVVRRWRWREMGGWRMRAVGAGCQGVLVEVGGGGCSGGG